MKKNYSSNNDINNIDFNSIFDSFSSPNTSNNDISSSENSSQSNNNFFSNGSNSFSNSTFDNNSEGNSNSDNSSFGNIGNFFNFFNSQNCSDNDNNDSSNPFGNIDIGTIMKMKSIMDKMKGSKNDPRSNLLRSLKPYLKPSRKEQVDKYIQLFGMTQVFDGMNNFGGEKKNDV